MASEKKDDISKNLRTLPIKRTPGGNNSQVQIFRDTDSNMAAQAWLRLASDKDCDAVKNMIKFVSEKKDKKIDYHGKKNKFYQTFMQSVKPEFITSAQQWLMEAGPIENESVKRLLQTLSTAPQTAALKSGPSPVYRQYRAEYVIHPDWKTEH